MVFRDPTEFDAYRIPRRVRDGCQHNLGCRCDPPYWLRASSQAEEVHERRIRGFDHPPAPALPAPSTAEQEAPTPAPADPPA